MNNHKKSPMPVDACDVISAGEMTGAIPLPPLDGDSLEAYEELMDVTADAERYHE